MIKLSADNVHTIKVDDVLYNWRTHSYCRVKAAYCDRNQRITIGQLHDTDEIWWTTYISLKCISDWRLLPDFDEEN